MPACINRILNRAVRESFQLRNRYAKSVQVIVTSKELTSKWICESEAIIERIDYIERTDSDITTRSMIR